MSSRSSVLGEIGWLLYFLAVFAVLIYVFNIFLVPLHFNDKIADVLAGLVAGLAMIATRAYAARRAR